VVPLVAPPSTAVIPTRLYPLYCTLYLCTLTRRHLQAQVALSFAFVSDLFASMLQCALDWLQLSKCFSLTISLRNLQTFVLFFLLEVADFLSRPLPGSTETVAATAVADPVDLEEMAVEKIRCRETQCLLGGSSLKLAFHQTGAQCLAGDISTGVFGLTVPLKFSKDIFSHFHNVAHPRRLASRRIISSRFVWHGLSSNITAWTCECLTCQWSKIHRPTRLAP
jgi:hypothetical protein